MAEVKDSIVTKGFSGAIGKELVFKKINGKTFGGKYPDRSKVKYTKEQIKAKQLFAKASKHASSIAKDPAKKAASEPEGQFSVYHAELRKYISTHKENARDIKQVNGLISQHLKLPGLNKRQVVAVKYMAKSRNISNAIYQRITGASKATATRDLQELVRLNIFGPPATRGAGAMYKLADNDK